MQLDMRMGTKSLCFQQQEHRACTTREPGSHIAQARHSVFGFLLRTAMRVSYAKRRPRSAGNEWSATLRRLTAGEDKKRKCTKEIRKRLEIVWHKNQYN